MAQRSFLSAISVRKSNPRFTLLPLLMVLCAACTCSAQSKPAPDPDVLVLSNGDTLARQVRQLRFEGKLTFHSDALGDFSLSWDKVKELHTTEKFAMVDKNLKLHGRKSTGPIPEGKVEVESGAVTLKSDQGEPRPPQPVKDALFIMDSATLDKALHHEPGFFSGWNGAATAGATVVTATQKQYTFSGGIGLVRAVPTVDWLNPAQSHLS